MKSEYSTHPEVAVMVVTYNSAEVIERCLDSVAAQSPLQMEVWVVDNQSQDQTVELVRQKYPWVKLVANSENVGFGQANNQILSDISSEFIFYLNPDAYLYSETLARALDFMKNHPEVGLAGTKIVYPDGTAQDSVAWHYPNEKFTNGAFRGLPGTIASLQGSSLIISTRLMRELGGFDPDFFLYGEDIDLCLRVRKHHRSLALIEEAVVGHQQGHTEKVTGLEAMWQRKLKGEYLFYHKHYPPAAIERIRQAQQLKSGWALLTRWLISPLTKKTAQRLHSQAKYQAIWQASRSTKGAVPCGPS